MALSQARIDARRESSDLAPTTRVGGIPLVVRQLRLLGRVGFARAIVIADATDHPSIRAALERYPAAGINVELSAEAVSSGEAANLSAFAIYRLEALAACAPGETAVAELTLTSVNDVPAAQRVLFGHIRKSVALDGAISFYVMRPFARLFTKALVNTPVSPNQVTLCALAAGLTAALLAALGGAHFSLIAGLLYFTGGIIDHVDGELARLRLQSSKLGEWLDSMTDEVSTFSLVAGLGIGLSRDGYGDIWAAIGLGACAIGAMTMVRLYSELHRQNLPIDTAQFPWFFERTDGDSNKPASALGSIVTGFGYLIRRDANIVGVSLLLAFDLRQIATIAIAAGAMVAMLLTITHYAVMAARRRAS